MAQKIDNTRNIPVTIEIPFEEYKELLIIKGKYEELKSQQTLKWDLTTAPIQPYTIPTITYGDKSYEPELEPPYKVTCSK